MPATFQVKSFPDAAAACDALARHLAECIEAPVPANEPRAMLLAGGSTPLPAYRQLAGMKISPGHGIYLGITDERHVPPDDQRSNFSQLAEVFQNLALPRHRLLVVDTEPPPSTSAALFQQDLEAFFHQGGRVVLTILGLGTDGHTAGLFREEDLPADRRVYAKAVKRRDGLAGITITSRVIEQSERVIIFAPGEEKKEVVAGLLDHPESLITGRVVSGHEAVELWTDQHLAS